jgi:hypothetical protein
MRQEMTVTESQKGDYEKKGHMSKSEEKCVLPFLSQEIRKYYAKL